MPLVTSLDLTQSLRQAKLSKVPLIALTTCSFSYIMLSASLLYFHISVSCFFIRTILLLLHRKVHRCILLLIRGVDSWGYLRQGNHQTLMLLSPGCSGSVQTSWGVSFNWSLSWSWVYKRSLCCRRHLALFLCQRYHNIVAPMITDQCPWPPTSWRHFESFFFASVRPTPWLVI